MKPVDAFLGLGQVVGELMLKPVLGLAVEDLGKPQGHFRRNAAMTIDQIIQSLARNAETARAFRDAKAVRLKALTTDDQPGM